MSVFGDLAGGGIDLLSGNKASDIQRKATRRAGQLLDTGYGQSLDLARPMQERSQQDYMNLSDRYREGDFRNPDRQVFDGGKFDYNPNDVFNDPEYKAQMRAGQESIESGAAGKGMLFSGNTGRALQKSGQDIFANRSDELYRRNRGEFETDRGFNFNAENRAYDDNAANRTSDFAQGSNLAGYAPEALDRSLNLNLGRAQAQADTELGVGQIRSDAWRSGGRKAGQLAGRGVDAGTQYLTGGSY